MLHYVTAVKNLSIFFILRKTKKGVLRFAVTPSPHVVLGVTVKFLPSHSVKKMAYRAPKLSVTANFFTVTHRDCYRFVKTICAGVCSDFFPDYDYKNLFMYKLHVYRNDNSPCE